MKTILKKTAKAIAAMLCVIAATSCNEESSSSTMAGPFTEFATIKDYTPSTVVFDLLVPSSDESVTVQSDYLNVIKPGEYPQGNRVMVKYNVNSTLNSGLPGEITFVQLLEMNKALISDPIKTAAPDCNTGNFKYVMSGSPYRTGDYLNFIIYPEYAAPRANMRFLINEASLNTDNPEIYLEATDGEGEDDYSCYPLSLYIAPLWNNDTYKSITIHTAAQNYQNQTFVISKQ